MDQRAFLRWVGAELGLPYRSLADALGVSPRTVEKWSLAPGSPDHRGMPLMAVRLLLRILDDRKRELIAAGDRTAAEAIEAVGAQVDPARLAGSLRTFDILQRSARRLGAFDAPRRKPRSFVTFARKNAWERTEETRNARRTQEAAAGKR